MSDSVVALHCRLKIWWISNEEVGTCQWLDNSSSEALTFEASEKRFSLERSVFAFVQLG